MSDLAGRTYLVTGANAGIGLATALELARRGGRVHVACRSAERGRDAVAQLDAAAGGAVTANFLPLDLADLTSVRACAEQFLARDEPLHGLINNAGIAGRPGLTRDGFEHQFGVNHLGHFLLTTSLLDRLTASAPARVVTVASEAHYGAPGIDFDRVRRRTRTATAYPEYRVSKLANVVFSAELGRRTAGTGVTTYALHPGVVASKIWRRVPWPVRPILLRRMLTNEQGARTSLSCATAPELAAVSGRYYDDGREREPSPLATEELAADLWDRSLAWTKL